MARRRSRIAHADYGYFSVTVTHPHILSHRILDPKYDAERDAASPRSPSRARWIRL